MGILIFLCIFSYGAAIKKVFRGGTFASALFGAFCMLVLSSYFFVFLLGSYSIAPYALIWGGVLLFLYFALIEKNTLKIIWTENRQIVIVYAVAVIVVSILLINASVWYDDEFNYWARAVKELYTFSSSYFNPFTNMRHRDYMLAYIPFQYSIVKVFGWREGYIHFVNAAAVVTASLAAIEAIRPKKITTIVFFLVFLVLTIPIGDQNLALNSLIMEVQLAVLFACSIIYYTFSEKNRQTAFISIMAGGTLVLLKIFTGLLFACVLVASMLILKVFVKQTISIKAIVAALLMVLFVYSSWSAYYRFNTMKVEYEAGAIRQDLFGVQNTAEKPRVTLSSFLISNPRTSGMSGVLKSGLPEEFYVNSRSALDVLVHNPVSSGRVTAWQITIVLLALAVALIILNREQKLYLWSFLFILAGLLVYLAGIFLAYAVQGETLSSFNRYYSVILTGLNIVVLLGVCLLLEKQKSEIMAIAASSAVLVLLFVFWGPSYIYGSLWGKRDVRFTQAEQAHEQFASYALPEGNTILVFGVDGAGGDTLNALYDYYLVKERVSALLRDEPNNAWALDAEWFDYHVKAHLAQRIIVSVDTLEYRNAVADVMGISPDEPMPWVFNVQMDSNEIQYVRAPAQ